METVKDASQIAIMVIALVGLVKPFIPEERADIIPGIAIIMGIVLSLVLKIDTISVIDGIMGSLVGVATYKVGSTDLKGKSESQPKKVDELIDLLNNLKK